jgi:hypothetical protein
MGNLKTCTAPGFQPRDGEEHRRRCFESRNLDSDDQRQTFFDKYGVRWTELARLPYFNLVRYTIIDPMHNLLLGMFHFVMNIYN